MISDKEIRNIIDSVIEYMYCNYSDCFMREDITWKDLLSVRNEIKLNALGMIKSNLRCSMN